MVVRSADVLITLGAGYDWRELGDDVREALSDALLDLAGWRIDPSPDGTAELAAIAAELLAGPIGALAESHGGSIELLSVVDDNVIVRVSGACQGCPAASSTLHDKLQRELRRRARRTGHRPQRKRFHRNAIGQKTAVVADPLRYLRVEGSARKAAQHKARATSCSPAGRRLNAVTAPATSKITNALRGLASALAATARQVPKRRMVVTGAVMAILVAVALLVPLPTAVQLRDWATSMGPWFPLAFLAAHIVVTVLPFPRTAFTLAAGLLFGPALGVTLAVAASAASAVIALWLVRAAGWQLSHLVRHQAVEKVDARLHDRGWIAVMSLRLIPAVPFSVLNYAVGASAVRMLPYTLATLAGLFPGQLPS